MKSIITLLLLLCATSYSFAQETQYETITNIPYYDDEARASDPYIAERCELDIYYPSGKRASYRRVVSRGGLTGGQKNCPKH